MSIPLVPQLLRSHLRELADNDQRLDSRAQFEGRDVEIEPAPTGPGHLCLLIREVSCRDGYTGWTTCILGGLPLVFLMMLSMASQDALG